MKTKVCCRYTFPDLCIGRIVPLDRLRKVRVSLHLLQETVKLMLVSQTKTCKLVSGKWVKSGMHPLLRMV